MVNNKEIDSKMTIENKKVQIAGLTSQLRSIELEKKKKKLASQGWELTEYIDNGITKSFAIFQREISEQELSIKNKSAAVKIAASIAVFIFFGAIISGGEDKKPRDPAAIKQEFLSKSLKNAKNVSKDTKKTAISQYLSENQIALSHQSEFYNCLSEKIYTKSEALKVGEVIGWCKSEFKLNNGFPKKYHNLDNLSGQFHPWDGSHIELERFLKAQMHDSGSYEHQNTTYRLVLEEKDPHLVVRTNYSGKNAFGARVKSTALAKIDLTTGQILKLLEAR